MKYKVQRVQKTPKTLLLQKLLLAGLICIPALMVTSKASAQSVLQPNAQSDVLKLISIDEEKPKPKATKPKLIKKKPVIPANPTYIVQPNENLDNIALKLGTTWQRIWNKNPALADPNVIIPGNLLIIPLPDEVIPDRPLPTMVVQHPIFDLSNLYEPGQCTWYVKNQRPDIPNTWGNAYSWLYNAQADGWATSSVPQVGAIAVRGNHVMYVEAVDGDMVTYSDMNGNWIPFELGYHTVLASTLEYIY